MVRNQIFEWVQRLARREGYDALVADPVDPERFDSPEDVAAAMAPYWERFDAIDLGPEARSPDRFVYEPRIGRVAQVLLDPDETNEWRIEAVVDVDASIEQGRAVLRLVDIVDDSGRVSHAQRRSRSFAMWVICEFVGAGVDLRAPWRRGRSARPGTQLMYAVAAEDLDSASSDRLRSAARAEYSFIADASASDSSTPSRGRSRCSGTPGSRR